MKTYLFFILFVSSSFFFFSSCTKDESNPEIESQFSDDLALDVNELTPSDLEHCECAGHDHTASRKSILNLRTGYINNEKVEYTVIDGEVMIDGDILIPADMIKNKASEVNNRSAFDKNIRLWPNNTVFYQFHSNLPTKHKTALQKAMAVWSGKTKVKFVYRTNQPNYIMMRYSSDNSSYLGTIGGMQYLNLNDPEIGTAIHELGHALGMVHEHQRSDRDNTIRVFDNASNFSRIWNTYNYTSFDFNSIMLYASSCNSNGYCNMRRKSDNKPFNNTIEFARQKKNGTYAVPSSSDFYSINLNYR
jgi:hypothetical protein